MAEQGSVDYVALISWYALVSDVLFEKQAYQQAEHGTLQTNQPTQIQN